MRLTLLDKNEEFNRGIDIDVSMGDYKYIVKHTKWDDSTYTTEEEAGGDCKSFTFRKEYQSERFSVSDEKDNLLGKPEDKIIKFCIENISIDEEMKFSYNIRKDLFIFD